jgi:alpha-L-fucosidase 2
MAAMTVRHLSSLSRLACIAAALAAAACTTQPRDVDTHAPAPVLEDAAVRALEELARHDVQWTSPGGDEAGSMPLGNGTFGANVWIDSRGDLLVLLSHTDAFSEIERLLKLGRVRISCDPPLAIAPFAQRMRFADGMIEVDAGSGDDRATVRVWIDAASEVLHATIDGARPRTVTATLERWRDTARTLEGGERNSSWVMRDAPASIALAESADIVVPLENSLGESPDAVAWYHRNESSVVPFTLEHQGLLAFETAFPDPLILRTFGGRIEGEGFTRVDAGSVRSDAPRASHAVRVTVACSQADDLASWQRRLGQVAASGADHAASRARTAAWWRERFTQSWVFVDMPEAERGALEPSRAYAAQRAAALASTGGVFPVKFNGSIFTVAPRFVNGEPFNDDFRRWGGDYWWQNTRLPYHGMLARGDGDRMRSLIDFYFKAIRGCSVRAKEYYGAEGAYFPETMTTFATYSNGDYGWNREGLDRSVVQCPWWQWEWNQGPELVALMLDHWDHTGDARMLEERTIPMARAVLRYFDTRFTRDSRGVLVISPTQALETYWTGVVNDLPCVAGLREITARLLALPANVGGSDDRALWERMRASCPPLPRSADGTRLAPAEKFDPTRSNCENPELYAVWPFWLPDDMLDIGRASFAARIEKMTHGWTQDGMQAARLGLADEAAANVRAKLGNTHANFRYPTFWGPNFDWVPDQCHGSNLLTTMQEMLLQSRPDGTIVLLPAWPTSWDARFRLHGAGGTQVTAEVRGGALISLEVDPPANRARVKLAEGWTAP